MNCKVCLLYLAIMNLLFVTPSIKSQQDSIKQWISKDTLLQDASRDSSKVSTKTKNDDIKDLLIKNLLEKNTSSWYKDFGIPLFSAILGASLSIGVFLIQERRYKRNEEKKQMQKYKICLESTKNELTFYCIKLEQVKQDIENLEKALKNNTGNCIIPSYSLYPAFLEKSKMELNSFFQNSELVGSVGHCHFELCHISERLNFVKAMFNDTSTSLLKGMELMNRRFEIAGSLDGFSKLIEKNIEDFRKSCLKIDSEIDRIKIED